MPAGTWKQIGQNGVKTIHLLILGDFLEDPSSITYHKLHIKWT